jgi:hypothetical protein
VIKFNLGVLRAGGHIVVGVADAIFSRTRIISRFWSENTSDYQAVEVILYVVRNHASEHLHVRITYNVLA